jgi:hypothetical protein
VQLIETQHQSHVWADQYERDARDILALQREVAEAIVEHITTSLAIAPADVNAMRDDIRRSRKANEHYLRGRYYWAKDTADGHKKAMELFSQSHRSGPFIRARRTAAWRIPTSLLGSDGFMPMRDAYPACENRGA